MFSVVIPVYKNEGSIDALIDSLEDISRQLPVSLEAVFVVDGSPDDSVARLRNRLPLASFESQMLLLSRNFGSFPAIMAGLAHGRGDHFAVLAADLQEPPSLLVDFWRRLDGEGADIVVGTRTGRRDPLASRLFSTAFWWMYRSVVQPEMPPGGVDVFGCTRHFRDHLLTLKERNTTLIGLVFWLGFQRSLVAYERQPRHSGRSAWSPSRKVRYLLDSSFAFSDMPIRLLSLAGAAGMLASVALAAVVLWARLRGDISIPGYAATVLAVMFFGGLNAFGIGLLGEYVWRAFENTKGRPGYVVARQSSFPGAGR